MLRINSVLLASASLCVAAPALAQTAAPAASTATATAAPNVAVGATVNDASGAKVGTIASVANGMATLDTGAAKATLPLNSFAASANGLVVGISKTELEAKVAQASASVEVAVGATVNDPSGAKVGTVKAVNGDLVTVASASASAQLPKSSFAKGAGGLVIAMTPAEFEAAAKSAGGARNAATRG